MAPLHLTVITHRFLQGSILLLQCSAWVSIEIVFQRKALHCFPAATTFLSELPKPNLPDRHPYTNAVVYEPFDDVGVLSHFKLWRGELSLLSSSFIYIFPLYIYLLLYISSSFIHLFFFYTFPYFIIRKRKKEEVGTNAKYTIRKTINQNLQE